MKGDGTMYPSAYTAYKAALSNARRAAHAILEALDNEQRKPEREVNWGDVGSLNHVQEELADILRFIRGEEE